MSPASGPRIVNLTLDSDEPNVELHETVGTSVAMAANVTAVGWS